MILYKYYPCNENSFKSLAVRGIWCHYPAKMNDPFECLAIAKRKYSDDDLKKFRDYGEKSNSIHLKKIIEASDEKLIAFLGLQRTGMLSRFAFCSLSEEWDNILMWSHYASSHTGFVIGFEIETNDHHVQKVNYANTLSAFDILSIAKILQQDYSPLNLNEIIQDFSIKSTQWSYEKEWRIWRDGPTYYHYNNSQIKKIYFGINCTIETQAIIVRLLETFLPSDFNFSQVEFADNPIRLKV